MKDTIQNLLSEKHPGAELLYVVLGGSHSYGTNTEKSDRDYRGVFIMGTDDFFLDSDITEINTDNNNISLFEIKKFISMLKGNNPTALEVINTTTDCVIYQHPIFDELISNRDSYLSKICYRTFTSYATKQIGKSKGKDKKNNWEKSRTLRKTPIDFCYLMDGVKTIEISKYLSEKNLKPNLIGLVKLPHARDSYAAYYDFSGIIGFRGIEIGASNEVRVSSIPKDVPSNYFIGHISFNKDAYSKHCSDYQEYQDYLTKRNMDRWIAVNNSESKIDGKNMMHTQRLIDMGNEIGEGKGVIMKRPNREYLLAIKNGEIDLETLLTNSQNDLVLMKTLYDNNTSLPERPSEEVIHFLSNSLLKIRKHFYENPS